MKPENRIKLIEEWAKKEKTFKRDLEDEISPLLGRGNAIFLYGPRRAGKSTIAKRLLNLWKSGKTRYINFEDPALIGSLDTRTINEFSEDLSEKDVIVLDEVQLVKGWEKWVRTAVDTKKCHVIVTGSSAKLLSSEFATSLGGRGIGFQVLPLSFKEFKRVTNLTLGDYLQLGGYPEIVVDPIKKEKLLESYFELTLLKDIIGRYEIRDTVALRNLALYLLTGVGKETSLKKIRTALGLSFDTIRQFISYLESAFLIFQVPFFSYSLKESLTKQRKVYAWDVGMQSYSSRSFSPDMGRKLENTVAIELKRRGYEPYYWKGKNEVDFIARKKMEFIPINVCSETKVPEREFGGLIEFCEKMKKREAVLLYKGETKKIDREGVTISLINCEGWLLGKLPDLGS